MGITREILCGFGWKLTFSGLGEKRVLRDAYIEEFDDMWVELELQIDKLEAKKQTERVKRELCRAKEQRDKASHEIDNPPSINKIKEYFLKKAPEGWTFEYADSNDCNGEDSDSSKSVCYFMRRSSLPGYEGWKEKIDEGELKQAADLAKKHFRALGAPTTIASIVTY